MIHVGPRADVKPTTQVALAKNHAATAPAANGGACALGLTPLDLQRISWLATAFFGGSVATGVGWNSKPGRLQLLFLISLLTPPPFSSSPYAPPSPALLVRTLKCGPFLSLSVFSSLNSALPPPPPAPHSPVFSVLHPHPLKFYSLVFRP